MDVQEHVYEAADGTRLSYREAGSGPAVLLLHGLQANATVNWFDPGVAAAVVDAGYRVVAPDMRGHGDSDEATTGDYTPEVLTQDVLALVRLLDLEPVTLVGYSYGSRTAALLAGRGDVRLRGLVLAGVAEQSMVPIPATPELEAVLVSLEADAPADDPGRQLMTAWRTRPAAVAGILRALVASTPVPLDGIAVPTVLVRSAAEPDDLVHQVPGARSVLVPGDHLTAPLDPEFRDAVLAFLAEAAPV